jgi:hypothetical protein
MAPFSNIERAVYYDDNEEDIVSLDREVDPFSSATSSTLVRKSSFSSSRRTFGSSSSSVTFATEVTVFAVLHISDYSLTERRETWYSAEETRQVRLEWKSVVHAMESSTINCMVDNDELYICVRGLEGKTYTGKQRRREARSASLDVVLNEQWCQGTDHDDVAIVDPVMIAMAYHELTYPMQVEAYKKAQQDAQVVGHSVSAEIDNTPKKFDFSFVRGKYFSQVNSDSNNDDDSDSDSTMACTVMTYDIHDSSNLLLCSPRSDGLRKRLSSCFVPLTKKRYARSRHSPTVRSALADVNY